MKKLLSVSEINQKLKDLLLIGPKFSNMPLVAIHTYAQTFSQSGKNQNLKLILNVLWDKNQDSMQSLKTLFFVNLLIYSICFGQQSNNIETVITELIVKITKREQERQKKYKKNRSHSRTSSVQKTVNWLKQKFHISKQKESQNKIKRSQSTTSKLQQKNKYNLQKKDQQSDNNLDKQELMISRIILPYCSYLLRLLSSHIDIRKPRNELLKTQQIWKLINLMKARYQSTSVFPTVLRYFNKQYYQQIFVIIKIIDFQTKIIYPMLQYSLTNKAEMVKKVILQVYQKDVHERQKIQLLQITIDQYNLRQMKQMLDQISNINELIANTYLGKYTFSGILAQGLKRPSTFGQNKSFVLVYDVIKQVDKAKNSKRLSSSKQKSKINCSFGNEQPSKIYKQAHQSSFALKKLKIVKDSDKKQKKVQQDSQTTLCKQKDSKIIQLKIQQISSKQQIPVNPTDQGATFRRMRMNMTNQSFHNQDSNTRRLRL